MLKQIFKILFRLLWGLTKEETKRRIRKDFSVRGHTRKGGRIKVKPYTKRANV